MYFYRFLLRKVLKILQYLQYIKIYEAMENAGKKVGEKVFPTLVRLQS